MKLNFSEEQLSAISYSEGPLLVNAGPGSGKTMVLTERIRQLLLKKNQNFHILTLTFSNKAANEIVERLNNVENINERAFIGTIHSFCIDVLRNRGLYIGLREPFTILQSPDEQKILLYEAIENEIYLHDKLLNVDNDKKEDLILEYLRKISEYKRDFILPESVEDANIKEIYMAYNNELEKSHTMDFNDLLFYTYLLFINYPDIANLYRKQYKYICIDEAQDLTAAHYKLIKSLCGIAFKNIMMVGDPNQSIYGFNGANPKYMSQFSKDFDARIITLTQNYRSSNKILLAAQSLFPSSKIKEDSLITGSIKFIEENNEETEALEVFNYIKQLINKHNTLPEEQLTWERCAILARNKYVFTNIRKVLNENKIKFYERFSDSTSYESNTMKEVQSLLFLVGNFHDIVHLNIIFNIWNIKIDIDNFINGIKSSIQLVEKLKQVRPGINSNLALNAIDKIVSKNNNFDLYPVLEYLKQHSSMMDSTCCEKENLLKDIEQWTNKWNIYLHKYGPEERNIDSFIASLALGEMNTLDRKGLALLTFHASKGLEFDVVAIMGMVEGIIPDYRAKSVEKIEEEKRNSFVAITRCKKFLILSYSLSRKMPWGSIITTKPSRFLLSIKKAINEAES
jgi:DNA helicase-2/ATP-dependent DNA helicase PcrA